MEIFVKYFQWLIPDCIIRFVLKQYLFYSSKNLETKETFYTKEDIIKSMFNDEE